MTLTLIVAHDPNLVIGKNGALPWRYPEDLKHFKETTLGHTMIMGRGVFEELKEKALPGRKNVVLSKTKNYTHVPHFRSLEEALEEEQDQEEVFIIGGGVLYKQTLPIADKLIVTLVKKEFVGDTFFPEYRDEIGTTWKETDRKESEDLAFITYERI